MSTITMRGARNRSRSHRARAALLLALPAIALQACAAVSSGSNAERLTLAANHADARALRSDITYLAGDQLEGRRTGTPGNDSAAAYIARRFAALSLRPLGGDYAQHFVARPASMHDTGGAALPTQNVVAMLPGRDPAVRGEYVVVGAHYDHLGRSTEGALDPDEKNAVRKGADDNASGTAAVMELARLFAAAPARRSIVFVTFSGEELGLLGSEYYVEHSPLPLDSAVAMINFDMVGRLRDDKLIVYGVATATELPALLDSANVAATRVGGIASGSAARTPLRLTALGDGFGPSDHSSFYAHNIPVLHFFTDLHEDYHRATDVASKINVPGEARVITLAERVARAIADRPSHLTFVHAKAPPPSVSMPGTGGTYFGSVPDMGATDVVGVRLAGVTPGSPADEAGVKKGDVVVEFGGTPVKDLYEYTDALLAHHPGDTVQVVVEREGKRVTLTATLGRRAQ